MILQTHKTIKITDPRCIVIYDVLIGDSLKPSKLKTREKHPQRMAKMKNMKNTKY